MALKKEVVTQLYEDTSKRVTSSLGNWTNFLEVVGRLYKYPYHEQLMIYAQKPDATACADFGLWNHRMNRYIKKGTTGIALIDPSGDNQKVKGENKFSPSASVISPLQASEITGLKYVFDIADTGTKENARNPRIWEMKAEYSEPILKMFSQQYDIQSDTIPEAIDILAIQLANDYYKDNKEYIPYLIENSFLEELDEGAIAESCESALSASIAYTLMKRCNIDTEHRFSHENFSSIFDFNTTSAVTFLGTGVSEQTEQVFREIAKTIAKTEREKQYHDKQNEQFNLQSGGGLQDSKLRTEGRAASGIREVWEDEKDTSDGTLQATLQPPTVEPTIDSTSSGNRPNSQQANGTVDEGVGEEAASTKQNDTTDGMGVSYEQSTSTGRGNDFSGVDLQLTQEESLVDVVLDEEKQPHQMQLFSTEEEQIKRIADRQGGKLQASKTKGQSAVSMEARIEADKLARCMEHFFNQIDTKYKGTIVADMPEIRVWEGIGNKKKNLTIGFNSPIADMSENAFTYFNRTSKKDEIAINEAIYNSPFLSQFKEDKDFSISFSPTTIHLFFHKFEDKVIDYSLVPNIEQITFDTEPRTAIPHFEKYTQIKQEYPDAIVLYPLGNCFETFGEDAKIIQKQLRVGATYRHVDDSGKRMAIVGFEEHSLENYVEQLRSHGHDVVVCKEEEGKVIPSFMPQIEEVQAMDMNHDFEEENTEIEEIGNQYVVEATEITQEDVDNAILNWNGDAESKARMVAYMGEHSRERGTAQWLQKEYGNQLPAFVVEKGSLSESIPWVKIQRHLGKLIAEGKFAIADKPNMRIVEPRKEVEESIQDLNVENVVSPVVEEPQQEARYTVQYLTEGLVQGENYHITNYNLGHGTKQEKMQANLRAIQTLQDIENNHRVATSEEKEVLIQYVGFGGLPEIFEEKNPYYATLKSLLDEGEYAAARASVLNAHYTSPTIIQAMYDAVEQMGFQKGNILEPSCGTGHFFGMLPESMKESNLYGVELDSITGRIAKQLYPQANIAIKGFEKTNFSDSFFDVAIGNVPFGNYSLHEKRYAGNGFKIHDHFFAKALDQVRPGGVVAFVTSKGTLDKENPQVRKYLAQRAELLGAIRLPNTAFQANAGTEVTADIVFLQKRENPIDIVPDWVHLGYTEHEVPVNSYFAENPHMILGEMVMQSGPYGMESTCAPIEGADLSEQLRMATKHIVGEMKEVELEEREQSEEHSIPADPHVKNYTYTVVDDTVYYRENSRMSVPQVNATAMERIKGMVAIRECVNTLIQYQLEEYTEDDIKQAQWQLNSLYDEFTKKYGLLNSRGNALAFQGDNSYYLLASLEDVHEDGTLKAKADMFTKRTIKPNVVVTSVDTPSEALAVSLSEKAKIDMEFMGQLTGLDEDKILQELQGVIFLNPQYGNHQHEEKYITADAYLSGNVREKLAIAKNHAQINPKDFTANVKALEQAQPTDLDASEIEVRLGATWIHKDYIEEFMYETFKTPFRSRGNRGIEVKFAPFTGEWSIRNKSQVSYNDIIANTTFGTARASAYRILEDTLNLRDIRIYDTVQDADGKEKRVLNKNETTLAQQKQQAIKEQFKEWIWQEPQRRQTLVQQYNETFNATRPREYDGKHITFGGINPEIQLREHQINAIAHILYGNNVLLAHEVGAGKSFEMVAGAMESKRLGLCNKPMLAVPNHLTEQMASEFLRLYPAANILVATKKDFETKNRKKFCARIATGDYDAVIIGHSQFERIPVSQERQERLLEEQIEEIIHGISEVKESGGERFTIKQLERTKKGLEGRLEKLQAMDRKDDVINFEQLGVDKLIVDEAHAYKNGFIFTKMRNIAGLGSSESQKSADMFMKCRYLDEITGGKGVVFATGTPISNSMVEMYIMQRYLQYHTLQEKGLLHFDAWASTFGETQTTLEINPQGINYKGELLHV